MANVLELNDGNFYETVKKGITLVDFWAPWCAPCRIQGPIMEGLAKNAGDKVKVAKVNVDDAPQAAQDFNVRAIPTVILFKDGKPVQEFVGVTQENTLMAAVDKAQ